MKFEDIKIGMLESYSQIITDVDVKTYAGISGDHNPIHMNDEYAEKSRYKKRIAHGMISSSFFSALFGTKLPGKGCVYVNQSLNFKRPVYLNDTVTAIVTVTQIDSQKRRVFFDTVCKVKNKIVIDGGGRTLCTQGARR
jgi:3-hydroxybutyryl-CoA dehydratase